MPRQRSSSSCGRRRAESALRGNRVIVPAHFDAEVFSALGRLTRAGTLEERLMEPILHELARAPFTRYSLRLLLVDSWSLRHNLSLRDALYVSLARRLEVPLVTADGRLAQAPDLRVAVTLVLLPS